MVNYMIMLALLTVSLQGWTQNVEPNLVDELDTLDQEKTLLLKKVEVAKLQNDLQVVTRKSDAASTVEVANMKPENLRLIKVTGLESEPQAVFLYNGYRMVANKGEMVLPSVQLRVVTATHVTIKDVRTGKESTLWLSSDEGSVRTGTQR